MNFYLGPEINDCLRGLHRAPRNPSEENDRMMAEDEPCPEAIQKKVRSLPWLFALIACFRSKRKQNPDPQHVLSNYPVEQGDGA